MAYFPNSTAGDVLDAQCGTCPLGDGPCPVLLVQLTYNYDQCDIQKLEEAMNILIDEQGKCRVREQIVAIKPARLLELGGQKRLPGTEAL